MGTLKKKKRERERERETIFMGQHHLYALQKFMVFNNSAG